MSAADKAYFRKRAIARRRDPDRDAKNEAAAEAIRQRVAAHLAAEPLIQRINAVVAATPADKPIPGLTTWRSA